MSEKAKKVTKTKKTDRVYRTFKFHPDTAKFLKEEAKREDVNQADILERLVSGPLALFEFEETTGKITMKWWKKDGENIGELPTDPIKIYQEYRDLRENFAPVSAGVNYHKAFASGGGFVVEVKNPLDKHQIEMRDIINEFNEKVYQDYYTKGMDSLNDIFIDEALTVGCSAAEIVFENDEDFDFYNLKGRPPLVTEVKRMDQSDPDSPKYYVTRDLEAQDWKKLGGIARLKFIDNAIIDLIPFRDPDSLEVRYWTLSKKGDTKQGGSIPKKPNEKAKDQEPLYLHPWQVYLVSWNRRGMNVKGISIIKPVLLPSRLMGIVTLAMGKGFQRWADKKYFFVCGSEKRPWGKVSTRNFLKSMELMIKNNWTGIPVPTGFDVKAIGGEIFDARNFLDFLKGMICAGMNYPLEFLEQGSTRAGDKAWLAWQVTYGREQQQLRRAIESQLWEKHLWGVVGQRHRQPKQGTAKDKRKWQPTFVPKVQWRSESKWHQETRLKMDTMILNVANPVGPQLKLGVEKDIARIMGWGDIIFPTYKDLEKALKKEEKTEKIEVENERLKAELEQLKLQFQIDNPDLVTDAIEAGLKPEPTEGEEGGEIGEEKEKGKLEKEEEKEKRPLPEPEKRLKGGVSRTNKETGTKSKKGVSKKMTRKQRV
jgi:hypothetical protein